MVPLIPHLRGIRNFAEPCAGDGALIRHLEEFGLSCVFAGDIRNGQDALALDFYGAADAIITNPPWSREVLHGLVTHFQSIAPTWLLLDADWKQTRQAAPFLPHCSDIVAIGRVKWIEGSKFTGKDNACWYKFDSRHTAGPVFHWRDQGEITPQRSGVCEQCGKRYEHGNDPVHGFVQRTCKQQAHRKKRLSVTLSVTSAHTPTRPLNHRIVRKYFATSDTLTFRSSRRRAGSHCPPSMAHITASTRC